LQIGFYLDNKLEKYGELAERLVASANKTMPGVPVFHLTNGECPEISGARAIRIPGQIPMGIRRVMHYAAMDGEWCFVDCDVLFLKDVRGVFEKPFDIAMADRRGTFLEGSEYERVMPYNFGVIFSRSRDFWNRVLDVLRLLPPEHQEWYGEQCATCQMLETASFHVLSSRFNYTPESKLDPLKDISILHLKGKRKTWFPDL
jgi:hypothetical protein